MRGEAGEAPSEGGLDVGMEMDTLKQTVQAVRIPGCFLRVAASLSTRSANCPRGAPTTRRLGGLTVVCAGGGGAAGGDGGQGTQRGMAQVVDDRERASDHCGGAAAAGDRGSRGRSEA